MLVRLLILAILVNAAQAKAELREPLTYEALKAYIVANNIRTRAELMAALPPGMLKDPKLMPATGSTVNRSSALEPRMVLTSTNPQGEIFTITISGSLTDPDALLVEIAESTSPPPENTPRVIEFSEKEKAPPAFIEDPLKHYKNHPRRDCTRCHGEDFRWIWDGHYNRWRGAYGSVHESSGRSGPDLAGAEAEREQIEKFRAHAKEHPIYRHLDLERMNYQTLSDANASFNRELSELSAARFEAALFGHPNVGKYRALLLYAFERSFRYQGDPDLTAASVSDFFCSPDFLRLVPPDERAHFRETIEKIVRETEAGFVNFRAHLARGNPYTGNIGDVVEETYMLRRAALLRYVTRRLGIELGDYGLPLNRNHLGFHDGNRDALSRRHENFRNTVIARTDRDLLFRPDGRAIPKSELDPDDMIRKLARRVEAETRGGIHGLQAAREQTAALAKNVCDFFRRFAGTR